MARTYHHEVNLIKGITQGRKNNGQYCGGALLLVVRYDVIFDTNMYPDVTTNI